jgi:cytochrome P450
LPIGDGGTKGGATYQLARIEGACALKALFRRWPKLELAVDESLIKWRRRPGLRAIEQLPVRPVP